MADVFSKRKRSQIMSRIRGRDTNPELTLQKIIRGAGYHFLSHDPSLPGTPDFVITKLRIIILVHGCFWHGHTNCRRAKLPSSNRSFWMAKIDRNQVRDRRQSRKLRRLGWSVLTFWTCRLISKKLVEKRIALAILNRSRKAGPRTESAIIQRRGAAIAKKT